MQKKFLIIVLALSVFCAFVPLVASAETSGTCGKNLTWILDDYGTLTISGTGNMENWNLSSGEKKESPFKNNKEIKHVVIEDGVTDIGYCAFGDCSNLKDITIADSVTNIGKLAFKNCSSLENIIIPNSVEVINSYTFYNCNNITRVTIPTGVTTIDRKAFCECTNLTDIYYGGTEEQWNKMSISSENDELENVTIHYKRDIPLTTATITKTETSEGYTFNVEPEQTYKTCYVYAAVYDKNGVLVKMNCVPLEMSGSTSILIDKTDKAKLAKVFILSDMLQPVTQAQKFDIQ
ncbi:MAG: leucine-rich repeat domain-containing protein [Hominilimicola sp.]|uniref:leucine-rich repeat domain-containing protein n=1 Tax=Hominilimicola sp. TaxID=3073571 RepID=UPI00307DD392